MTGNQALLKLYPIRGEGQEQAQNLKKIKQILTFLFNTNDLQVESDDLVQCIVLHVVVYVFGHNRVMWEIWGVIWEWIVTVCIVILGHISEREKRVFDKLR